MASVLLKLVELTVADRNYETVIERLTNLVPIILNLVIVAIFCLPNFPLIVCTDRAYFSRAINKFIQSDCLIRGTYDSEIYNENRYLSYYKWSGFSYLLPIFIYIIAQLYWKLNSNSINNHLKPIFEQFSKFNDQNKEEKVFNQLVTKLIGEKRVFTYDAVWKNKSYFMVIDDDKLNMHFVVYKLLNLLALAFNIIFLCKIYDFPNFTSIFDFTSTRLFGSEDYLKTTYFPHMVRCEATINEVGRNNITEIIVCDLPQQVLHEKCFGVSIGYCCVAFFIGFISLLVSFISSHIKSIRDQFYYGLMKHNENSSIDLDSFNSFVQTISGNDYVILKLINSKTNELLSSRILNLMYSVFVEANYRKGIVSQSTHSIATSNYTDNTLYV